LHASAIVYNNKAKIFTGGRAAGKSIYCLEMLRRGAKFLGDDLIIINKNYVYAYPKRLNLFYYHFNIFPALKKKLNFEQRFFVLVSSVLSKAKKVDKIIPVYVRAIRWLSNYKIKPTNAFNYKNIIANKVKSDTLYLVQYVKERKSNDIKEISEKEIIEHLIKNMANERKEFRSFYKHYLSYPENKEVFTIENAAQKEREILNQFIKNKKLRRVKYNSLPFVQKSIIGKMGKDELK